MEQLKPLNKENSAVQRRIGKVNFHKLFRKITAMDYAILWIVSDNLRYADEDSKVYLKDISENMNLPMQRVTSIVRELQNKGLVIWTHDGSGEDGTYIRITDLGIESVMEQREILERFHKNVTEKYGEEKFMQLIGQMLELEDIMHCEIEKENTDE